MRVRVVGIERHWIHVLVGLEEVSVYQDSGSVCRGRGGVMMGGGGCVQWKGVECTVCGGACLGFLCMTGGGCVYEGVVWG